MTTTMVLQPQLIQLLDRKAREECGDKALLYSSTYLRQLKNHISGNCILSNYEIKTKVDYLAGCLTITLDNPIQDLEFLRVRICEDQKFGNVDDLSYIKQTTDTFPKAGRLNEIGQALFYASVAIKQDDTAVRVVLSEAGAKDLDRVNVLRSHQVTGRDLNLQIIGIWDQVRRDKKPYYLNNDAFDYYKMAREYMVQKFDPKLLLAYELTDRFFADILSREGSKSLYQVTSTLSSVFQSDGVLYSSVQAKEEPVVALIPQAVDDKLDHLFATDVVIEKSFGYEFFQFKTLAKTASIGRQSGKLEW